MVLQIRELAKGIVSGAIYARLTTGAVHPLYTLCIPNGPNGDLCTCAGIEVCTKLGRIQPKAAGCKILAAQLEEFST